MTDQVVTEPVRSNIISLSDYRLRMQEEKHTSPEERLEVFRVRRSNKKKQAEKRRLIQERAAHNRRVINNLGLRKPPTPPLT
jgi:hypothetical protein